MEPRVSLITLGVSDLDRSRRFYETLGWAGDSSNPGIVFFQVGAMVLALWDRAALAADSVVTDHGGWSGITLAHNVRSPDEVERVLAEALAAGGRIARAGAPTAWGGYSGVFHDPDGHPWEVAHNPGWRLGPDGAVSLGD